MHSKFLFVSLPLILSFTGQTAAQAGPWAQCGGIGFTGPTTCVAGWVCTYSNPYHSQCLQYSSTTATTTFAPTPTTTYTPLPTLSPEPGWGYVNGDETIGYYLQSEVLNTASRAVFSTPSNASQIQIADGQLVQNALGTLLYAVPEARANSTVTKLAVSWSTEPATGVTFVLTRDYVTMGIQISGIENPGFLLCQAAEGDYYDFFLNLDNDITPPGCTNETVFIYFGSIAV